MKEHMFFTTSIGKKILVALTGLFMIVFLVAHLAGNLEIFSGPDAINQYAAFLKSVPKLVWSFRILLIVSVIAHVFLTINLTINNRKSAVKYHVKKHTRSSLSSRTMMLSGLTIITFVLYHLAHYTFGLTNPQEYNLVDHEGRHHVYNMVVLGFSHPLVSSFYILAQGLLAFHLSHGVSSAARTLGVASAQIYQKIKIIGVLFAVTIATLYISIPVAVLVGVLPLDK